jgi:hypothetical protein
MNYSRMTSEELNKEHDNLVRQRSVRLRDSNPYKRLSAKINIIEKELRLRSKEARAQNSIKIQERTRRLINAEAPQK